MQTNDEETERKEKIKIAFINIMSKKYSPHDDMPIPVHERLYVGSIGAAYNKDGLVQCGITHVLCVAELIELRFPQLVQYKRISIRDDPQEKISDHFHVCINFIHQAITSGGNVLVHCFAGKSRSVSVIVAYLMKKHGFSFQDALTHIRKTRPQAQPNAGFAANLLAYERQCQEHGEMPSSIFGSQSSSMPGRTAEAPRDHRDPDNISSSSVSNNMTRPRQS